MYQEPKAKQNPAFDVIEIDSHGSSQSSTAAPATPAMATSKTPTPPVLPPPRHLLKPQSKAATKRPRSPSKGDNPNSKSSASKSSASATTESTIPAEDVASSWGADDTVHNEETNASTKQLVITNFAIGPFSGGNHVAQQVSPTDSAYSVHYSGRVLRAMISQYSDNDGNECVDASGNPVCGMCSGNSGCPQDKLMNSPHWDGGLVCEVCALQLHLVFHTCNVGLRTSQREYKLRRFLTWFLVECQNDWEESEEDPVVEQY